MIFLPPTQQLYYSKKYINHEEIIFNDFVSFGCLERQRS